ncbi:MAG: hypothetical protein HQM09_19120 [Candidatus Riflebacteria bacterium]|nr:hypothetical protein [Candidatus Riflebacteria bacterium]
MTVCDVRTFIFRKTMKTGLVMCLVFLAPILFGQTGNSQATSGGGTTGMKEQFERKISEFFGVPVSVAEYGLDYSTVHLRGIRIGDSDRPGLPFAEVREISATCNWMSLLGGNIVLENITIASLTGRLTRDPSGSLIWGNIRRPASGSLPVEPANLPFEQLKGNDLEIRLTDQGHKETLIMRVPSATIAKSPSGKGMLIRLEGTLKNDVAGNESATESKASKNGISGVKMSGQIDDLQTLRMTLNLTADPLDLAGMGSLILPANGYTVRGSGQASATITGTLGKLTIAGATTVSAGTIEAPISKTNKSSFAFPFKNLVAPFHYSGDKLTIMGAHAEMFGGVIEGRGDVSPLKIPVSFSIDAKGHGIQAEAFLAQNTSQKQVISGPVNGTFQAEGDVTGLASWNGKGTVSIPEGRYQAPPVITPVLSILNLSEFASGDLRNAGGTFTLHGGIMTTNDFVFPSTIGKADFHGDVGLDTTLKGQLNLVFSQAAVKKSQVLQEMSLNGTSVDIPTKVEGTLLAPSFPGLSSGKLLELGVKREGQKILQGIIQGGKQPAQPPKGKKSLESELKKIFKF